MMQTESFKDPKAFLEVASKITSNKPILAIKAGRTRAGSVAVSSHTGTLVDQAAMASAMYRKAGVVEFHDTDEMVKAAIAFSTQDPPRGSRIGIITNTGGPGIQAVDESVDQGLELATWSEEGRKRLAENLYAEASLGNPVDVVATANHDHYHAAVDTLLQEEGTDMVLVFFVTAPFTDTDAIARRIKEATESSDKPVVVVVETYSEHYDLIDRLRSSDLPVYEFAEDGARALAAMRRYAVMRDQPREEPPELSVDREKAAAIVKKHSGKDSYLPQVEAFEILAAYGVPVPKVASVGGSKGLAAAAKTVGFPCVLKVDSTDVIHKSDSGGVVLNIADQKALDAAFQGMANRFDGMDVSYVLMEQKPAGHEIVIGVTESPGLGSLVMFGLGGIFVEVMKDVVFAVAPLGKTEARDVMRGIKGFPVLEGMRGDKGADLFALEEMLLRVSRLAADFPAITEMDLNPVLARPDGSTAVDVRMKVR
jgi:acetyltransferase